MKIKRHEVSSSVLLTVDEKFKPTAAIAGAFVRVRPTQAATDQGLRALKKSLYAAGARAVKVMPKPAADTIALSITAGVVAAISGDAMKMPPVRELLAALVKASPSERRDELMIEIEDMLAEAGL